MKMFILKTLFLLTVAATYLVSALNFAAPAASMQNIEINADKPLAIDWPFEIAVVGDEGEKGLRIGPNIGRGWCGEAGGQADYKFYIPADDQYTIWAYCLWFDECSNAIFAKIDQYEKTILGNDPLYNQWHWVRGFSLPLKKGTHSLQLSNHSDDVSLQKILFTNSPLIEPQDCGVVFSDIFYDGFDGCDMGNFDLWEQNSGIWQVFDPLKKERLEENYLVGTSQQNALIMMKNHEWSDYSLHVSVQTVKMPDLKAATGICFGLKNPSAYHLLKWRHMQNRDYVKMQVVYYAAEAVETLHEFQSPWKHQEWHNIDITVESKNILIKVDDQNPIAVPVSRKIIGGIGLWLQGDCTAYFDDIHVRQILKTRGQNIDIR